MIEASPFAVLATCGDEGLDSSPRGDAPGFVRVVDEHTLLLPERPGNNRIDSLRNLLIDPRLSLLFLIPGIMETLRVRGRGTITVEPALLEQCAAGGSLPRCVVRIAVERAFFQCGRAIRRSHLWDVSRHAAVSSVPSAGAILSALSDGAIDAAQYDRDAPARQQANLY